MPHAIDNCPFCDSLISKSRRQEIEALTKKNHDRIKASISDAAYKTAAWILAWPVSRYIVTQRDRLRLASRPLFSYERLPLKAHFESHALDKARVAISDPLPVSEPSLTGILRRLGFRFPSIGQVAAITLDCVIASREVMDESLLFHELVHVTQFRLLGVREFSRQYVLGFLKTRTNSSIPLERMAFDLQARFSRANKPFKVEVEVSELLKGREYRA